jgi:glycosyltransferase involved in cell wall biosynthesis
MKAADVFVSVSYFEGMPNTVAEAMACGCPLVLSDIPQHREICPGDGALYADPRDPRAIAKAVVAAIDNSSACRTRAQRAQSATLEWSPMAMAERYEAIYREVLSLINSSQPSRTVQYVG